MFLSNIFTPEQFTVVSTSVYHFVNHFSIPQTTIGTIFGNFFIKYLYNILMISYICILILGNFQKLFEKLLKSSIINNLSNYVENEISKLNGIIIIISLILIIVFLDLLIFVSSFTEIYYNSLIVWLFIILLYIVIVIPLFILYDEGFYFLAFLRGSASKNSLFWEFIIDYMNLISFFLRINIQLIRILIITIFFLVYNEFYDANITLIYNSTIDKNNFSFSNYYMFFLNKIFYYILYFLFELGHFWLIFFIQTTVFTMILIILVQFLYTCFLFEKLESFFKKKRNLKIKK